MIKLILVLAISFFSAFLMWKAIDASGQIGFRLSFIFIVAILATMYVTARLVSDDALLQVLFQLAYAVPAYGVCINALAVNH